jgi:hypothetical protein
MAGGPLPPPPMFHLISYLWLKSHQSCDDPVKKSQYFRYITVPNKTEDKLWRPDADRKQVIYWSYPSFSISLCLELWKPGQLGPQKYMYGREVTKGSIYFAFCRLYSSSPSHHGSVWHLPVILTNTVSWVRACLSIWFKRFRGSQKEDERGPLSIKSSLGIIVFIIFTTPELVLCIKWHVSVCVKQLRPIMLRLLTEYQVVWLLDWENAFTVNMEKIESVFS